MDAKPSILVVCGRNKRRSRTAEHLFKNDSRFNIRSVGLSPQSERQLKEKDILWADLILVMEDDQKCRIKSEYQHLNIPRVEVLDIPDEYEFMNEELASIITHKMNSILQSAYNL